MTGVVLEGVGKRYGALQAIKDVDIDVAPGKFVVLVGPSGCGKSTLLKMIAGLEEFSEGTISIGGVVVNDLAPKDRDIAMVFQSYALYPHMTVAENLGFALKLKGTPRAEAEARVAEAARILGLGALLDRYPRHLSGGQRQRVAMGRAIVRQPAAFLFDEPLSNLDAKLRVSMRSEIKALHQRLGATIIYVTHDQVEAMTMADRIVVLREGRVEQVGTPMELYRAPANRFVATFIGSPAMNLIDGRIESGCFVSEAGPSLPLPGPEGRGVTLGVRPEDLNLVPEGWRAKVRTVEPTGSETYVTMTLGGVDLVGVFRGHHEFRFGTEIHIAPTDGALHVFDGETGLRLPIQGGSVP